MVLHPALHRCLVEARFQEVRRQGRRRRRRANQPDLVSIARQVALSEDADPRHRIGHVAERLGLEGFELRGL